MEKEDQIIKELIQDGFLTSAPEDFTDNVMKRVANTPLNEKSLLSENIFMYAAIIVASFVLAGGIIYFVDPGFYMANFGVFYGFLKQVTFSFSGIFSGTLNINDISNTFYLMGGITVIILVLLVFDRLLSGNRKLTHLFV